MKLLAVLSLRIIMTILIINCCLKVQALNIENLKTEYRYNPIGIDTKTPHFSWQLISEKRSTVQNSYQLTLSKNPSMSPIAYDTGVVVSSESANIELENLQLEPCTRYYWCVTVSDNHGDTAISEPGTYFETGLLDSGWNNAKWITYENEIVAADNVLPSPLFRKEFQLDSQIVRARLYTSALGVYTLYVNGFRVGENQSDGSVRYDELMPGWTDYRKTVFYMTHDVTSLLHEGINAIGTEISSGWWLGEIAHGIYNASKMAFIGNLVVELENGETVCITTDNSWKYSFNGPILNGSIYNGEIYDARRAVKWTSPEYDTDNWTYCIDDSQTKGELIAHEGPTVRILPELERKAKTLTVYDGFKDNGTTFGEINTVATHTGNTPIKLLKGQTIVVDFGQNASGWAKFKVNGKTGTTLSIRYAEMINDSGDAERGNDNAKGTLYTVALRTAKAEGLYTLAGRGEGEVYRPTSTFYGFRYCDVTTTDDVEIEWITAETISTDNEEGSYVIVDNDDINQLSNNIIWGQRSNFISVPTDCPQRDERMGWTADTQVFSMAAMYNAQVQGFYHKWMRDMRDGQQPTGEFPDVAPYCWEQNVSHGASGWADAGIIMPWNVYIMYGDKSIIEENYDSMTKYMEWISSLTDGEYQHIGSDTKYGDWLAFEDTDKRFVSVAYYAYMTDLMYRMSHILSTEDEDYYALEAIKYQTLLKEIKTEFKKRYWDEEQNCLNPSTQCALLMTLRYGLLDEEDELELVRKKLRESIENNSNKLSTGFLGTAIINQTLSENRMDDIAYNLLLQHECPSWLYSVDQGATTMWERWDSYTLENGFSKSSWMNSFNHYAYGAIAEWMYRYMAGISPDNEKPGFKQINLQPRFDLANRISNVESQFSSTYGYIKSSWKCEDNGSYTYEVTIPTNTSASLILPTVNEEFQLFESSKPISESQDIGDITDSGLYVSMTLGSGDYSFNYKDIPLIVKELNKESFKLIYEEKEQIVKILSEDVRNQFEIRTLAGILVTEKSNSNYIDVSKCEKGCYIIIVTDNDGLKHSLKLLK